MTLRLWCVSGILDRKIRSILKIEIKTLLFMKNVVRMLSVAIIVMVIFTSCSSVPKSSLVYFQDIYASDSIGEYPVHSYELQIQPGDELVITVSSVRPEATLSYNLPMNNPATSSTLKSTSQARQQTYLVSSDGEITLPVIGKLHVAGLSVSQLTDKITELVSRDVVDPVVMVRLVNFKVNVMGEVKEPKQIEVDGERMSILDALAAAGDLTVYGNRENVLLIREEDGVRKYYHINLNDSKLLESPQFYLQQNDVIVVSPNQIQQSNSRYNQFNAYKLSVISTVVSAASVIASLVIALTIK